MQYGSSGRWSMCEEPASSRRRTLRLAHFLQKRPTRNNYLQQHFSLFKLYCVKHIDNSAFNGNLLAGLFMKQSHVEKKTLVDLKGTRCAKVP